MGWIKDMIKGSGEAIREVSTLTEGKGTTRLKIDNDSDNSFTKAIRPIIAIWVLAMATYVMLYSPDNVRLESVVYGLLSDVIVFYFAARTTEKVVGKILTTIVSLKGK